jgi:inositol hexakisphosphate/diphosphoinositol-pentakisphosphate kinase
MFRDANGKEVRNKVELTPYERDIARKIVLGFKQRVCGFDLLRANGNRDVLREICEKIQ